MDQEKENFIDFSINDRVKQLRDFYSLSQKAFAEKMGFSRDVISNIEYHRNEVKDYVIKALCREFKVDYIWLMSGSGEPKINDKGTIEERIDEIMEGESEFHKNLIKMAVDLSVDELKVIEGILDKYIELKKRKSR